MSNNFKFWLAVCVPIFALFAIAVLMSAAHTCANPPKPALSEEIAKAGSCLEFWFNRYQGLLSALIAAVVAFIVVQPAYLQLRELRRQTALAGLPVAQASVVQADEELKELLSINTRCGQLADAAALRPGVIVDPAELVRERTSLQMALLTIKNEVEAVRQIASRRADGKDSAELEAARQSFFREWELAFQEITEGLYAGLEDIRKDAYGKFIEEPTMTQRRFFLDRMKMGLLSASQLTSDYRATLTHIREKRVAAAQQLMDRAHTN